MGEYLVPSISWTSDGRKHTAVHFAWEFGVGDTSCGHRIPARSKIDRTPDREITCPKCLFQVYDIQAKSRINATELLKIMKTNEDLLKLIQREIERLGSQKAMAEALEITPGFLNDILQGRAHVTQQVAEYFGYDKVTGFVKHENKAR